MSEGRARGQLAPGGTGGAAVSAGAGSAYGGYAHHPVLGRFHVTVYFGLSDDEGQLLEVNTDRPPVVGEAVILPGPGGDSRAYEVAEAVTVVLSGGLARDAAAQTVFLLRPREGRPPQWAERFHAGLG